MSNDGLEALYGGSAGSGKSFALLAAALQYVRVPGYAALLLRRTFRDLNQPDALIPRSKEWLSGKADWNDRDKRWTFPNGATLTFGYLEHADDIYQYQGAAYQFCGLDEATQFDEPQYRYLFSRLRRLAGQTIPVRMRGATNPGGRGHLWVKQRFLTEPEGRLFVPALAADNPHLDQQQYRQSLAMLDPITRRQLADGDWDAQAGGRFSPEWFRPWKWSSPWRDTFLVNGRHVPRSECTLFVTVDPSVGATKKSDRTAAGVWAQTPADELLLLDVVCASIPLPEIVPAVAELCEKFSDVRYVGIEANAFQMALVHEARKHQGVPTVFGLQPGGRGKLARAQPAILRAESGQIYLPEAAPWKAEYVAELTLFTGQKDAHDDQVDMTSYAVELADKWAGRDDAMPEAVGHMPRSYP